ncbi:hypothetical protein PG989_005802 [Apiospora arundinis]
MTTAECKIHEQIGEQVFKGDRDGSFCILDLGLGVFSEAHGEVLLPNPDATRLNLGANELAIWPELSRLSVLFGQEDSLERNVLALSDGPCDAEVKSIAQSPTSVRNEDVIPYGWTSGAAVQLSM